MKLLSLTKIIILTSLTTLSFLATPTIAQETGSYKSYKIFNCKSENAVRDYCGKNKGDLEKVLQSAKNLKSPNFDKDKKLVQLFFKGNTRGVDYPYNTSKYAEPMTDFFVVDEKLQHIYHVGITAGFNSESQYKEKAPYAPKALVKKGSSWLCLYQDGAEFIPYYSNDGVITFNTAYERANSKVCVKFGKKDFYPDTVILGDFDETKKVTYDYTL